MRLCCACNYHGKEHLEDVAARPGQPRPMGAPYASHCPREGQATRDVGAKPWLSASLSDPGTGAKAVACATGHTHTALKMLHVFLACFQVLQGAGRKQG